MSGLTREAIVKALHDKGAYCGVCDYETALDGTPECSECRQVLNGYADVILALTPAVPDRHTLARTIWETSRRDEGTISVAGAAIVADAVLALLPGPSPSAWPNDVAVLRRAATIHAEHGLIGRAESLAQFADHVEAGGRP